MREKIFFSFIVMMTILLGINHSTRADSVYGATGEWLNRAATFSTGGSKTIVVCNQYYDLAVAPYDSDAGAIGIFLNARGAHSFSAASAIITGENTNDYFGSNCASAGDVNADGYEDLLVADPYDSITDTGAVYLISGGSRPLRDTDIGTLVSRGRAVEYYDLESKLISYSYAISAAGDVNGDGYDDFIIGDPSDDYIGSNAGAAYLILGSSSPTSDSVLSHIQYFGESSGDYAGYSVAGVGDVNGDGYDDFMVGVPYDDDAGTNAGAAYLILGSSSPTGGNLRYRIKYTGETTSDLAGLSVAGAGDVDGDGYDDLLIGDPYDDDAGSNAGAAYLVLGSSAPTSDTLGSHIKYIGEAAYDSAGFSVAGLGDVDSDGYADFMIGAPDNDDGGGASSGAAYVVSGSASPTDDSLPVGLYFVGKATSDFLGSFVGGGNNAVLSSIDNTYIIGAPANDDGGTNSGQVWVLNYRGGALTSLRMIRVR